MKAMIAPLLAALVLAGCAQAPVTGRSQFMMIPPDTVIGMSTKAYYSNLAPFKQRGRIDADPALSARVRAITRRVIQKAVQYNPPSAKWRWEIHVVETDELNAYCMPGGKMAIYSGLITRLTLADDEIAAVMAHEIGHAIANHGAEKMSASMGTSLVLALLNDKATPQQQMAMEQAATLLVSLPHSRLQESEADRIGVHIMAMAGYHPQAAVNLFRKMAEVTAGTAPAEFFSDHPSDKTRIKALTALLPQEMPVYDKGFQERVAEQRRAAQQSMRQTTHE